VGSSLDGTRRLDDCSAAAAVDPEANQRARDRHAAQQLARCYGLRHVVRWTAVHLLDEEGYLRCEIELLERASLGKRRWQARYYWILLDVLRDGAPFPMRASAAAIESQVMREIGAMTPVLQAEQTKRQWQLAQLRERSAGRSSRPRRDASGKSSKR
jgi:hypothetical protein